MIGEDVFRLRTDNMPPRCLDRYWENSPVDRLAATVSANLAASTVSPLSSAPIATAFMEAEQKPEPAPEPQAVAPPAPPKRRRSALKFQFQT